VCNLSVLLDFELTVMNHVSKVTSVCFSLLRCLRQVRHLVGYKVTAQLIKTTDLIMSRDCVLTAHSLVMARVPQS